MLQYPWTDQEPPIKSWLLSKSAFRKRLRRILKERDITQAEFARRTGIYRTHISHVLSGRKGPNLDTIIKCAKALNVSVDHLLGADHEQCKTCGCGKANDAAAEVTNA